MRKYRVVCLNRVCRSVVNESVAGFRGLLSCAGSHPWTSPPGCKLRAPGCLSSGYQGSLPVGVAGLGLCLESCETPDRLSSGV